MKDLESYQRLSKTSHYCKISFSVFLRGDNDITDSGLLDLAGGLASLKNLSSVVLYFSGGANSISDEGLSYLSLAMKHLKSLTHINFDFSGGKHIITDKGIKLLSEGYLALDHLNLLALHCSGFGNLNDISDNGIAHLFEAIGKLPNLQVISLGFSEERIMSQMMECISSQNRS